MEGVNEALVDGGGDLGRQADPTAEDPRSGAGRRSRDGIENMGERASRTTTQGAESTHRTRGEGEGIELRLRLHAHEPLVDETRGRVRCMKYHPIIRGRLQSSANQLHECLH